MLANPQDDPAIGAPVVSYGFARRKVWSFGAMLVAMLLFGLGGVAFYGVAGQWGMIFLLIVLPAAALVILAIELRLEGPVLVLGAAGILDRRKGRAAIRWAEIQEATLRGRLVGKGVRIVLATGERYDIDLSLVDAEPKEVMLQIQKLASRATATGG